MPYHNGWHAYGRNASYYNPYDGYRQFPYGYPSGMTYYGLPPHGSFGPQMTPYSGYSPYGPYSMSQAYGGTMAPYSPYSYSPYSPYTPTPYSSLGGGSTTLSLLPDQAPVNSNQFEASKDKFVASPQGKQPLSPYQTAVSPDFASPAMPPPAAAPVAIPVPAPVPAPVNAGGGYGLWILLVILLLIIGGGYYFYSRGLFRRPI